MTKYLRTKEEICALAIVLIENNAFYIPHSGYKKVAPHVESIMDNLEYVINLLTKAAKGKKVKYEDSPEIIFWLNKQSSPLLDGFEDAVEKRIEDLKKMKMDYNKI